MATQAENIAAQVATAPAGSTFDFGQAMTLTFQTLKARFWQMFGLFLCTIPVIMLLMFVLLTGMASMESQAGSNTAAAIGAVLGVYLVYFLVDALLRSTLLVSALSYQAGEPTRFAGSFARGLKHTPMVFLISLVAFCVYIACYLVGYVVMLGGIAGGAAADSGGLAVLSVILGILLVFAGAVPAFYLWCRWYVNTAARVAEGTGFASSFHRSRDLTMGHKWTIAGHWLVILALAMLVYMIIYAILVAVFAEAFMSLVKASANPNPDLQEVLNIYSSLFSSIGTFGGIFIAIIYFLLIFLFVAVPACSYAACFTLLRRTKEGDVRVADVFN